MKNALQQKYGFELLLTLYGMGSTEFVQIKKKRSTLGDKYRWISLLMQWSISSNHGTRANKVIKHNGSICYWNTTFRCWKLFWSIIKWQAKKNKHFCFCNRSFQFSCISMQNYFLDYTQMPSPTYSFVMS